MNSALNSRRYGAALEGQGLMHYDHHVATAHCGLGLRREEGVLLATAGKIME